MSNIGALFSGAQVLNQVIAHLSLGEMCVRSSKAYLKPKEAYSYKVKVKCTLVQGLRL